MVHTIYVGFVITEEYYVSLLYTSKLFQIKKGVTTYKLYIRQIIIIGTFLHDGDSAIW